MRGRCRNYRESMPENRTVSLGAEPDKVEVVYNGTAVGEVGCAGESTERLSDLELLAVGRLCTEKGFDVLVRALALVRHPGTRLRIVGDGPERSRLQQLCSDLGIVARVEFTGSIPRQEIGKLYGSSDIVVLPSRSDAMPLVALEAMVSGRAIIATRVGGLPEIVEDEITGLIVPSENPHALASAIARLSEAPDLRRKMGIAAKERSSGFAWPHLLVQFEEVVRCRFARRDHRPQGVRSLSASGLTARAAGCN